jgi:LacI family repressor for deo operon, udp, cdd, tsx, nupC, and nupG
VLRRRVDGVLVVGLTMTADEVAMIESLGVPLVYIGSGPPDQVRVHVDDAATARRATEHLLALGHRRIGHIGGYPGQPTPWASEVQRAAGYADALRMAGVAHDRSLIAYGRFEREGGRSATAELLARAGDLTAVVVDSDEMAFGVLDMLRERRLRVPEDISVIGIDGHPVGDLVGLTTCAQDAPLLGEAAAGLVLEMITGAPVVRDVVFPTELVERGSTRAI